MDAHPSHEPGVEVRLLTPDAAEGFTFGGILPNRQHDCDVRRYQHLDRVTLDTSDIELASDHGRELLEYVTA